MDTMLKESVAALFCHVIKLDDKDLSAERPLFYRYMKQDFGMTEEEASALLDKSMCEDCNVDTQISMIANGLTNETYKKMSVLKQLNHIIVRSKLVDDDYDLFDKVKEAFFPEKS
ncbi:MAG: Unknown protein [uncultured Sulfurovum sp.]|uniref:Co-chaperone DjlA N-terminal domain-containing protein n=1 Tax=uncultured Sulfurovum sp. TaxID=269237 RepID=A0A6S6T2J8_9BACT|nr:MAG: Unknown protein [uncultured Sulfurovum sp.]